MSASSSLQDTSRVDRDESPRASMSEEVQVSIDVQPPGVFENNNNEVKQVATTDSYTIVARQSEHGHPLYQIYDESGSLVKSNKKIPAFIATARELGKTLENLRYSRVASRRQDYRHSFEQLAERAGYKGCGAELEVNLTTSGSRRSEYHYNDLNQLGNVPLISPPSIVKSDYTKSHVVFQRGKKLYVYLTEDSDGKVLHPNEWNLIHIEDNSQIDPALLAKHPFLREFIDTQKGRPIGETSFVIDNERGILNLIDSDQNQRIYCAAASGYAVDPTDNDSIYYITPDGTEIKTFKASEASLSQTEVETHSISINGEPEDLRFDPNGNFLIVRVKEGEASKLVVYTKDTFEVAAELTGVGGDFDIDNTGNLYFVDTDGKLRFASTNFMTFQKGGLESARETRRQELLELQKTIEALDLDAVSVNEDKISESASEGEILRALGEKLDSQFTPALSAASTLDAVREIAAKIEALKDQEEFDGHRQVFRPFEDKLVERVRCLKADKLVAAMDAFEGVLQATTGIQETLALENDFGELLTLRRDVAITDPERRREIDTRLKKFEEERTQKLSTSQAKIREDLEAGLAEIEQFAADAGNLDELSAIVGSPTVTHFHQLRMLLQDRDEARGWREKYKQTLQQQRDLLEERARSERELKHQRIAEQLEESNDLLAEIQEAIDREVKSTPEFDEWRRGNPLIVGYRARLIGLPEDVRKTEEAKLERILKGKKALLRQRQELGIQEEGQRVTFGKRSFPVFQPEPGKEHDRDVPKYHAMWTINEHVVGYLDDIARHSEKQIRRQRRLLILEGEAGTGKNVLADIFAHYTNREIHTFSANYKSEKEDLTYDFGFDPARGTFREDSEFIRMLQTPGSIIVIDEINTLPPGLTKMLNPLFDYRRRLHLPDGRVIKADPSVVFIGTMNPQHYLGVQELPKEFVSRSRIMHVEHPPLRKGTKYSPFEAEMIAKSVNVLKPLTTEEFYAAWDYVVNGDTTNGADQYLNAERTQALKDLHVIVKTANKIRESYRAFHSGQSNDMVEFIFTLRESDDIADELNDGIGVKQAIRDVVLPKIGDPTERQRVKAIIDNV